MINDLENRWSVIDCTIIVNNNNETNENESGYNLNGSIPNVRYRVQIIWFNDKYKYDKCIRY